MRADWISPPGDTISDLLEERGWTADEFARKMGIPPEQIGMLIRGEMPITPEIAQRLEQVLGGSARFWKKREAQYRLSLENLRQAQ